MKIRDVVERLSKLDPDMDMNDLRECLTTNKGEADELVELLDKSTDSWDEFSAALTKDAVIPMLLEIRDLMLLPTSEKGWVKPAEMAKKVAEQVAINEARCQERIAEVKAHHEDAMRTAENEHQIAIADLGTRQSERIESINRSHEDTVQELKDDRDRDLRELKDDHTREKERLGERISGMQSEYDELQARIREAIEAVPGKQAEAVAKVLSDAADRVEAMGQMRLAKLVKRKLFRNRDLDQTMLRVEADGILLSAKRLRQMAAEAAEQNAWPVEFADGEEDTPEAQEALARMLAPIRETEPAEAEAEEAAEIEVET